MLNHFPIGVLARTEQNSRIPFLDDLSHHMLVVAAANLTNSSEAVLASLMHDMFKGLMIWSDTPEIRWLHFSRSSGIYEQVIPSDMGVDAKRVETFIQTHHDQQVSVNPIRLVESNRQGLITSLERKLILDHVPDNTKALVIKLSGRYRWLLAFYIQLTLKRLLTDLYSDRLNSVLRIQNVIYHYIPANLSAAYSNINDCLRNLNLKAFQAYRENDGLHINLPVWGLSRTMTIAYGKYNSLSQNQDSLQVPLGEALSLMAFDGASSGKAKLLYVDAGFTLSLDEIVRKCLETVLKNRSHIKYSPSDIARSLEGTFRGPDSCSFCGEQAARCSKLPLRDTSRFTSVRMLLDPHLCVCPSCIVGYELEEQLRGMKPTSFRIPMTALVNKIQLGSSFANLARFIRCDSYHLMSLSGELWLQILSEVWYQKYQQKGDADYLLDPKALMLPLEVEFIPQGIYPLLHARQKKFALESGLFSSLVLPGTVKDIDANEFRAIRQSYRHLGVKAESFLKRIKQIYEPL